MKRLILIPVMAALLAGGAIGVLPGPSQAQVYRYAPPPANIYGNPWVGPNTPWVYYNGDWFLNGVLYYFFGPRYGWAPYYAYAPTYIVRPPTWYGAKWHAWYRGHPRYWTTFHQKYPYWAGHRHSHRYDRRFYERHHRGYGRGWHKGYRHDDFPRHHPGVRRSGHDDHGRGRSHRDDRRRDDSHRDDHRGGHGGRGRH